MSDPAVILEALGRGLDVVERIESLGPLRGCASLWLELPKATRENLLGLRCHDCGEPRSRCECCPDCGFTPCACDDRFEVIDTEGVSID
jgi:hypothetical protein